MSERVRTVWWAPGRADWLVAASFIVGSSCFALGAFPPYAELVGPQTDGVTFFVGSIFFTTAALLQLLLSSGVIRPDQRPRRSVQWRQRVRAVDRPEWWAGAVQFVGTLMFNLSTWSALDDSLSSSQAVRRVWTPDVRGCVAFLIASMLVFADVRRPWLGWRPHDLDWSIAWLNLLGSVAFAISAIGAYTIPSTGTLLSVQLDNLGTFIGGICFLVGAVLLIHAQARGSGEAADAAGVSSPAG